MKDFEEFLKKFRVWRGEPIDYHVCIKRQISPDDYKSTCCICKETIYYKDLTPAKNLICIDCVVSEEFKKKHEIK